MQGMSDLIDENIRVEVLEKLDELAAKHQVTIISAIESGSRSWGFPSPDSDYDIRIIYSSSSELSYSPPYSRCRPQNGQYLG